MIDMTVGEYIFYSKIIFIVTAIILGIRLYIQIDTMPDKETRRRIKEIAKKNNLPSYVVANEILRDFCNKYDKEIVIKFKSNPGKISFEEWKAAREAERQSDTESSQ